MRSEWISDPRTGERRLALFTFDEGVKIVHLELTRAEMLLVITHAQLLREALNNPYS